MDVLRNESLAKHTTFKIGGAAEYFIAVHTEEDLIEAVAFAVPQQLPLTVLGGGSNMLVSDDGVSGVVLKNCIKGISADIDEAQILLTVGAGEVFDDLVAYTVEHGYWGLENLSSIPGSTGATPIQNVGAYGVEISEFVESVRVYDIAAAAFRDLTATECQFAYRDSLFKHKEGAGLIVTQVVFKLSSQARPRLTYKDLVATFGESTPTQSEIRNAVIAIRSKKFPDWYKVGTAGSFFKNPIISNEQAAVLKVQYPDMPMFKVGESNTKIALGWVLDKLLHLKGVAENNVGAYEGQALVLIANDGATEKEVRAFANKIQQQVREKINVEVEWEVTEIN